MVYQWVYCGFPRGAATIYDIGVPSPLHGCTRYSRDSWSKTYGSLSTQRPRCTSCYLRFVPFLVTCPIPSALCQLAKWRAWCFWWSGKCLKERAHSGSFACRLSGDRIRDTPIRSAQCQKTGTSYGRAGTFASKRAVSAQAAAGLDEAQAEADTTISGIHTKHPSHSVSPLVGFFVLHISLDVHPRHSLHVANA